MISQFYLGDKEIVHLVLLLQDTNNWSLRHLQLFLKTFFQTLCANLSVFNSYHDRYSLLSSSYYLHNKFSQSLFLNVRISVRYQIYYIRVWVSQHPPPSKTSCFGISWMGWNCPPRVSLVGHEFFFSHVFFPRSHFVPGPFCSLAFFFGPTILEPKFFSGNSYLFLQPIYPSNVPSSLPPPNPCTSLPFVLTSTTKLLTIAIANSNAWSAIIITKGA